MNDGKLTVLLSCMNQEGFDIVNKSNILSDVIIINQTNYENNEFVMNGKNNALMISTKTKGLSKSRNLALSKCNSEFALLCDDDEVFTDNMEEIIIDAFRKYDDDILLFNFSDRDKGLGNKYRKIGKLLSLKVSSWQIAFRTASVKNNLLHFDENLGAGTPNGAGEENLFLLHALKAGLKIAYVPRIIGSVAQDESTWFDGYTSEYFYKRGISTRYIFGFWFSIAYAIYYIIFKRNIYCVTISIFSAFKAILKGIFFGKLK